MYESMLEKCQINEWNWYSLTLHKKCLYIHVCESHYGQMDKDIDIDNTFCVGPDNIGNGS